MQTATVYLADASHMAVAVWRRNAAVYRHTWIKNILPNFFEPLLYLVGMGVGLGAYLQGELDGTSYITFIAPGLMAAAAMNGATFETTYNMFVKLHFGRLYDAFLCTPATLEDIAFGSGGRGRGRGRGAIHQHPLPPWLTVTFVGRVRGGAPGPPR